MTSEGDYQGLYDRVAALREQVAGQLGSDLIANPQLADAMVKQIEDLLRSVEEAQAAEIPPPDRGLAQLVGVGPDAARSFPETRIPPGVEPYDETVTSERIIAMGDLYYLYQHETIGVFKVVQKLQELFKAGAVYLSGGPGAYSLYQFDRREVLRYTLRDRIQAYRRAFGYGTAPVAPASRANTDFHGLFVHFANQVSLFWRDKRVSDVIRERAYDPSFGSIAIVRRAGLDLRNNLKFTSYGHLNVLRVEVMQLLEEAFKILGSDDVKNLFGADTAWDVVEIMLTQYWNQRLDTSPRQRMAVAAREMFRWLAQPHILKTQRAEFETLLLEIVESAEEWLTSAQSLGLAQRTNLGGVLPFDRSSMAPTGGTLGTPSGRRGSMPAKTHRPRRPVSPNGRQRRRESEFELEL
jgi:hypothetical protein